MSVYQRILVSARKSQDGETATMVEVYRNKRGADEVPYYSIEYRSFDQGHVMLMPLVVSKNSAVTIAARMTLGEIQELVDSALLHEKAVRRIQQRALEEAVCSPSGYGVPCANENCERLTRTTSYYCSDECMNKTYRSASQPGEGTT